MAGAYLLPQQAKRAAPPPPSPYRWRPSPALCPTTDARKRSLSMKRVLLLAAFCATLAAGLAPAGAATVTVASNPLWTDTGITLSPPGGMTLHDASGSWNYGGAPIV